MKNLLLIIALAIIFPACQPQHKEEKSEIASQALSSQLGNAVLWFQQSAEMQASFHQAYKHAELLIKNKLDTLKDEAKPAVILDLDETILDNSPYEARLIKTGTTYQSDTWKAWCEEASANALPGALDFLNFADKNGVQIFYISNRKENVFEATLKNLQRIDAPQADSSHLMLRSTTSDKTERRNAVKLNHNVLLYIGDNLTDYDQLYAERKEDLGKLMVAKNQEEIFYNFIMLPNPMYGEWEAALYENDFSISDSLKLAKRTSILYTGE